MSTQITIKEIQTKTREAQDIGHENEFNTLCAKIDSAISTAADRGWNSVRVDVSINLPSFLIEKIKKEYDDFKAKYDYQTGDTRELDYDYAYFNFYW